MKKYIQKLTFFGAVICVLVGLSSLPARADDVNDENVRAVQLRLMDLGYHVGFSDGVLGPETREALAEFQRINGLPITGVLTSETSGLLFRTDYLNNHYFPVAYQNGYYYNYNGYVYPSGYTAPAGAAWAVDWRDRWFYTHTQQVQSRFATINVNEDDRGSMRHYAVMLNGRQILFANNQPGILRVSRTFEMNGEDAVIFSAYNGDGECAYKNYLLTLRSDGTYMGPREIGNCSSSYQAYVASDDSLIMNFPDRQVGWGPMDMWRYQNGMLMRI